MTLTLTIDGQPVEASHGQTVLEAARSHGIEIPTLCYHKDLSPVGSCRLCLIEVDGLRGTVPACTLPARDGMVVRSETPALVASRRLILELLLRNYLSRNGGAAPAMPTEFMRWVERYDVRLPADFSPPRRYPADGDANPFILVDLNKCILCTRCVRACAEVQGRFVWAVMGRGQAARIAPGAAAGMLLARCESCGACVAYCPTGALDNRMSASAGPADSLVTTTCAYCGVGCQFDLNVKDGRVIRVTSNPNAPVNGMALCVKGRYGYDYLHHPDRLTRPRVREYLLDGTARGRTGSGDPFAFAHGKPFEFIQGEPSGFARGRRDGRGRWVEVDWDTALEITARKLREIRDRRGADAVGVLTSAKCLNEENYLMNKFARQVIGTNNIDHCARL